MPDAVIGLTLTYTFTKGKKGPHKATRTIHTGKERSFNPRVDRRPPLSLILQTVLCC